MTDDLQNLPQVPENIRSFKRNELGLLEGIKFVYNSDGYVDWRKMIPKKYLYLNNFLQKDIEEVYKKPLSEIDIEADNVDDKYLIISLPGVRYLATLRGYNSYKCRVVHAQENYAAVEAEIKFLGNFETFGEDTVFSAASSATLATTKGFGNYYLVEMAENRAFGRAVRNFLKINILSHFEVSETTEQNIESAPTISKDATDYYKILETLMAQTGKTFNDIQNKCIEAKVASAEEWKGVQDIPKQHLFSLIEKLKKVSTKKKSKSAEKLETPQT